MVMIATCCWCMGHGFGEVWVPLFSRTMGPGVGGLGVVWVWVGGLLLR